MKVKLVNKSKHPTPAYETAGSAGMDLRANLEGDNIELKPLERILIPTGLYIELPLGYEAQVRSRSGLSLKKGLTVLNAPGTIDSDYRGEVGVILANISNENVVIENGDRVAQLVIANCIQAEFELTSELSATERGSGGFGHTGTK